MNIYKNKKTFAQNVNEYFCLKAITKYNNGYRKKMYYISDKITFGRFSIFLLMSFFMIFTGSANVSKIDFIGNKAWIIGFIIFLSAITCVLLKHIKFNRVNTPKCTIPDLYKRELPSNLRPAHVRLLLEDGIIDEHSLSATLMDLINRDYIKLEYNNSSSKYLKYKIFRNKDIILKREEKDTSNLFLYERYLLDWFFSYNKDNTITAEQLHKSLNNDIDYKKETPHDKMSYFQSLVLMSFPIEKYYNKEKLQNKKVIYLLFLISGFIPWFAFVSYIAEFLAIYGLGNLMFISPSYTLNQTGVNEIAEWKALKKYLNDFSNIKDKNAQMVELWDYYLVYSIAFSISSIASNEMYDFFGKKIFKFKKSESHGGINISFGELEDDYKKTSWDIAFEEEMKKERKKYEKNSCETNNSMTE